MKAEEQSAQRTKEWGREIHEERTGYIKAWRGKRKYRKNHK